MNLNKTLLLLCCFLVQHVTLAATEYLRLVGTVDEGFYDYYDNIDLEIGQFIYFDFEFDTEIEVYSDPTFYAFEVNYYGGNYPIAGATGYAASPATDSIFKGISLLGPLYIQEEIYCAYPVPPPRCVDVFAFDWEVGTTATLRQLGDSLVANLEVTYRGSSPPRPIPLPAAFWLMLSAAMSSFGFGSIAKSRIQVEETVLP